jgi:serine/threonine protein kinase
VRTPSGGQSGQGSANSIASINAALPPSVRVAKLLAQGGQGVVFTGAVGGTPAAVKVYFPHQVEVRVDREVDALQRLSCRTIARLLWAGHIERDGESVRVVATELISGPPLSQLLSERPLSVDELGRVLYDVTDAISNFWAIRLVHRDLKPSNMIISNGRAVVIDLGVARCVDQASLTVTGATWGTLGYLSPEQTRGAKQLTCKSDLFALGVIALESILQRHPTGGDQLRLLSARFDQILPPTVARHPHAELIRRLLTTRPSRRPSPELLLGELAAFAKETGQ